jgi:hypothetical protein
MSILISGVEMPKDKAISVVIHPDGTAYTAEMFAGVCTKYLGDCTAASVPPHGPLIDYHDACRAVYNGYKEFGMPWQNAEVMLSNAPTIIPSEV